MDDYKCLIWQIGHGNYTNIERLICVALKQGRGIQGILEIYESAAQGVYQPKSFTEEEEMLGILFWQLGGIQLAEITHHALNPPGMTTLHGCLTVPQILPSYSQPSMPEIEKNITSCFKGILLILKSLPQSVVHVVLMFDEIAIEKHIQWDNKTDFFLGTC